MWLLGYDGGSEASAKPGCVGLKDLGGGSSFANAGLQCLSHIEPLSSYFKQGMHLRLADFNHSGVPSYGGEIARAFAELQLKLWKGGEAVQDARTLQLKLASLAPKLFDQCGGEDVQEFLIFLLETLHADLHKAPQLPLPTAALQEALVSGKLRLTVQDSEELAAAVAWVQSTAGGRSFITDLLQGQLRTTLTCRHCGHCAQQFEPFLHLSLPVTAQMESLSDAFQELLKEQLARGSQWTCGACQQKADALKRVELWRLPPVLLVHLRRIAFDHRTLQFQRVECALTSPLRLDLAQFCASQQKSGSLYDMACVANHLGPHNAGHYTAVCRVGDADSGSWHTFDNDMVQPLPLGRPVLGREASLVVLERHSAEGAGGDLSGPEEMMRMGSLGPLLDELATHAARQGAKDEGIAPAAATAEELPMVAAPTEPPEGRAADPLADAAKLVLMEGWLCRCSLLTGEEWAWQWAVLVPGALCFFTDSTRQSSEGELGLCKSLHIDVDDEPCAATGCSEIYVFTVCQGAQGGRSGISQEECCLATDSWDKLNAWTQAIRRVATEDVSDPARACCVVS